MKISKPSIHVEDFDGKEMLRKIEQAGRTCYKSEANITDDSAEKFVANIIKLKHESVLEHEKISVRIICDRGVTHEFVRHRIASYSQESTRYVNYEEEVEFIEPCFWSEATEQHDLCKFLWIANMNRAEKTYQKLIKLGATPQEARSVLPNSLKTEIVVTMNLRAWRHFLRLRCAKSAHPQIKEVADMILDEFRKKINIVFDTI